MHSAIEQLKKRVENAKSDSDFSYFFSLLLMCEQVTKLVTLGFVCAVSDNKDRARYRLEYRLARADGIGEWVKVLEEVVSGPTAHYLLVESQSDQVQLTKLCRVGDWQYDSIDLLKKAMDLLAIDAEDLPQKSDLKRWFRLFATLRNKTRGHGAISTNRLGTISDLLVRSVILVFSNLTVLSRPWAYLYRNLSGKYRVSMISGDPEPFDHLRNQTNHTYPNGVYIHYGKARRVDFVETTPELQDFFILNGGFSGKKYELLSYSTDNRIDGDAAKYLSPPEGLPESETHGYEELQSRGNCFSNVPDPLPDYISRPTLESELFDLLLDDRRTIITLVGKGGIGKTSLSLRVIPRLYDKEKFSIIVWFSSRDVDLQYSGPKAVRQNVFSQNDMASFYANLVLDQESRDDKNFKATEFFQKQMTRCDIGPCLFVFDNFETTQNPLEMYSWIDTYIRTPNKALITTRLRDFKGDYPKEVFGMEESESVALVDQTARQLRLEILLTRDYVQELISVSEGHPYVLKILLGNVAVTRKLTKIERIVAGSDEILTALFERTYASLSPCAQRAMMTLSSWNSSVPRIALEAVLLGSIGERSEVEKGVESLVQYSIAEVFESPTDKQEFIGLPLVASIFGRKKLSISPLKAAIQSDIETLQMLGPSHKKDVHLGVAQRLKTFIVNIARRLETGETFEKYAPIVEMICRNYNPGWLILARWQVEAGTHESYLRAETTLKRFLENSSDSHEQSQGWLSLADVYRYTGNKLGELHAHVERAQLESVPFSDVSNSANLFNRFLHHDQIDVDREEKRALATRLASVLEARKSEARADDFSRMGWLAVHLDQNALAREYAEKGLELDQYNFHCRGLLEKV